MPSIARWRNIGGTPQDKPLRQPPGGSERPILKHLVSQCV